jgi:tRNA dimethylallyltransferase
MRPKVIAIVGPTASGKTSLGIYIAQKVGGEIISADSRQVYKGLNIGTGKVTKKEMAGIPHHLLDVASPKKQFSVDDFITKANRATTTIYRSKHIPVIVGGTGLYIDTFVGRMSYPNVPPNEALRAKLDTKTTERLLAMLQKLDPRRATSIEPHHKRRIIRAIEIAKAIGASPLPNPTPKYDVLWIGLNPAPEKLQKNIRTRLKARLKAGMVAEARRLHGTGLSYKRMGELGLEYRCLALLLQNKLTKNEFEEQLERAINQYAKRQLRWFKRNKDIHWVSGKAEALRLCKKFLSGR